MATWQDLYSYIRTMFHIAEEHTGALTLVSTVSGDRSQKVFVRYKLVGVQEEWVQISSPICEVGQVDVNAVLLEVGTMVCGGLAIEGPYLVIRDALPLKNMQYNEFSRPFNLITTTADELEKRFLGVDRM